MQGKKILSLWSLFSFMNVLTYKTTKKYEIIDITKDVADTVCTSKIKKGICVVYTPHAIAAIIINENWDDSVQDDFLSYLNQSIPEGKWKHDQQDENGTSHVKAALVGPSKSIIVTEGKMMLGR